MARPENNRKVNEPPLFSGFKPIGIWGSYLDKVNLTLDEFEAFRLADHLGMSHEEAAEEMEVSRPVFSRLIQRSRNKIASFIVTGKKLEIGGGNIHFRKNIIKCQSCGHMFKTSFGKSVNSCPSCGSDTILNLAGGFGHGKCCGEGHHHRHGHGQGRGRSGHIHHQHAEENDNTHAE